MVSQHFWCSDYSRVRLDQMYVKFRIELSALIIYEDSLFGQQDEQKIFLQIKPFHTTDLFWYPLKTSENLRFSDVFREYQERSVAWNGLTTLNTYQSTDYKKAWIFIPRTYNKINAQIPLTPATIRCKTHLIRIPDIWNFCNGNCHVTNMS